MSRFPLHSLWFLTKGRRLILALLYVMLLVSATLESIGIASLYPIIDMLQDADKITYYGQKVTSAFPFMGQYLDRERLIALTLIAVGLLFLFKNAFYVVANYGNIRCITHLYCSWMKRIFKSYFSKSYQFFVEHQAGDLVQRQLVQTLSASTALRDLINILMGLTTFLTIYTVIWVVAAKATLILTLILIPVALVVLAVSRGRIYRTGDRIVELEKQGFALSTEIISGMRQVKVFGTEDYFTRRFLEVWNQHGRHKIRNAVLTSLPRPVLETLVVIGSLYAVYISLTLLGSGGGIMPVLAVLGVALIRIIPLVGTVSNQTMNLASLLPSAETVAHLLEADLPKHE